MTTPSIYFLHLTFSGDSPNKILTVKVKQNGAHLHPLTNASTKSQHPTPYSFRDTARRDFNVKATAARSNGHTMLLHTCTLKPMSLPNISFLAPTSSEKQPKDFFPCYLSL